MRYVGIDAGKRHWVCVLDRRKNEVVPKFEIGNSRSDYAKLRKTIGKSAKICIEETGPYSMPLLRHLQKHDYDVLLIKGLKAKRLREYVRGNIKTDIVDCEMLAMVRLMEKSLPVEGLNSRGPNRQMKQIVRLYRSHVDRRAKLKQKIRAILHAQYPEVIDAFYKPVNKTVLSILRWTSPEQWDDQDKIADVLRSHDILPARRYICRALDALRDTIGLGDSANGSLHLLIDTYFAELTMIATIRRQMAVELLKTPYATLILLPNVNLVTASILAAEAGDIRRFPKAKKFVKYCGFRFSRKQSGNSDTKTFWTAPTDVRWVLSAAANNFRRTDPHLKEFAERLKRRGKKPLVIRFAVARKILIRLYHEMVKRADYTLADNLKALRETDEWVPPVVKRALSDLETGSNC